MGALISKPLKIYLTIGNELMSTPKILWVRSFLNLKETHHEPCQREQEHC